MPRYIKDPKTGERTLVQPASVFAPICQQLNEQLNEQRAAAPPEADEDADEAAHEKID